MTTKIIGEAEIRRTTLETLVPEPHVIRTGNLDPAKSHKAICWVTDCRDGRRWASRNGTEEVVRYRYRVHYLETHPVVRTPRDLETPWVMSAPYMTVVDYAEVPEGAPGHDNPDRVDVVFADGIKMAYTYSTRVYLRANGTWDLVCDWLSDWRFRA